MLTVAVKSCQRDRDLGFHQAIRETWGKDIVRLGGRVLFFYAGTIALDSDEVAFGLNCPDDYLGLPLKTHEMCKWLRATPPEYTFFCDNDTIVNARELMALPYQGFDYAGHFRGGQKELGQTFFYKDDWGTYPKCYPWASGGYGYFLSKKAVQIVANNPPQVWAEDMYVGQVMGPRIQMFEIQATALKMSGIATWHFRKSKLYPEFTPALLRRIYADGSPEIVYEEAFGVK